MSIAQYIEGEDIQDNWIDYIIEALRGTCNGLTEYREEYEDKGYDVGALTGAIDENIWCCESCNWWVEVCDTDDDGTCTDCQ